MARSDVGAPTDQQIAHLLSLGFVEVGVPGYDEMRRWADRSAGIGILFHPFNPLPWGAYWRDDVTGRFYTVFTAQLDTALAVAAMAYQQ